jgi:hypothetical protein
LPVEILAKQILKFNIFSGRRTLRPQIINNQLRLQRYENFLFLTFRILMYQNRSDIASVFDISVNKIVALVLDQIQKTRQRV